MDISRPRPGQVWSWLHFNMLKSASTSGDWPVCCCVSVGPVSEWEDSWPVWPIPVTPLQDYGPAAAHLHIPGSNNGPLGAVSATLCVSFKTTDVRCAAIRKIPVNEWKNTGLYYLHVVNTLTDEFEAVKTSVLLCYVLDCVRRPSWAFSGVSYLKMTPERVGCG